MNLLERLRVDRGLTINEVATGAGVGRMTVIRAEADGHSLQAPTAKALADFYGMAASDLLIALRREQNPDPDLGAAA